MPPVSHRYTPITLRQIRYWNMICGYNRHPPASMPATRHLPSLLISIMKNVPALSISVLMSIAFLQLITERLRLRMIFRQPFYPILPLNWFGNRQKTMWESQVTTSQRTVFLWARPLICLLKLPVLINQVHIHFQLSVLMKPAMCPTPYI